MDPWRASEPASTVLGQPRRRSPWRPFLVSLGLLILLALSALFTGLVVSGQRAIDAEVEMRARTLVASIVLARKWNALHGGVYVEKRPGVTSSRWLVEPDVDGANGKTYTLRNPALMAREMAELAEGSQAFRFRITSLKPLNPGNFPDQFEADALRAFERGEPEVSRREHYGRASWLRYMAPLLVEESCLPCHGRQGYRVGQIRGGISVAFPVDAAEAGKTRARVVIFALFVATLGALAAVAWKLVLGLRRRLDEAEGRIRELATTDDLTGLRNRRYIQNRLEEEIVRAARTRRPLSVALFDVDHFKRINDTQGHDGGDEVLRSVGAMALRACRGSDLVARFGGDEFLIVLPETDPEGAGVIAERLRTWIEAMRVDVAKRAITVTASFGVATLAADAPALDALALVKRADEALYRVKAEGRNRVAHAP
jgi:diguanylate cyclase (GGDEF)-like protein